MEIIDVLSTSNMYLNYLIHSKVEKIKSLNIDLTCGFKNTLDFLNLFELTTILGNLIDNAIEAQKYVENKRFIKLSTIKKADRVRLIIENSCNIEEIHMDNQKLITSKEDKENHGIGFNRVCEVVKEKNGIIVIFQKDCQIVPLYKFQCVKTRKNVKTYVKTGFFCVI